MSPLFFLPLTVVAASTLLAVPITSRLRPRMGTWCLTGLAGAALTATAGTAVAVVASGLPGGGAMAARYGFCRHLAGHGSRPAAMAAAVLVALAVGNVARLLRRERRELLPFAGSGPVAVVDLPGRGAFAVPGRPGTILVTTGLLAILSTDERRALFAHEGAHLDLHHHRHIRVVNLAAAAVPVLRPLVRRVRFTTERWADEQAACQLGDRSLVARALARAAVGETTGPAPSAMSAASLGVAARVRALDANPHGVRWEPVALAAMLLSLVAAATQAHHVATALSHLCG